MVKSIKKIFFAENSLNSLEYIKAEVWIIEVIVIMVNNFRDFSGLI